MNGTNNTIAAMTADITQEVYEDYVYTLVIFSSTTLLLYATLITFSQEKEHIWSRPFSLSTLLYIFTRYGILINQGLGISLSFITPGRSCILAVVQNTIFILPYIGVQGLLVIWAYSICKGNKIVISAFAFGFLSYFSVNLYGTIAFSGCITSPTARLALLDVIGVIIALSTDLLIFGIFMRKVWGIWRLKYNNGIQSSSSLISVLLTQSILRCCFVVTIAIANVPITWLESSRVSQSYTFIQDALSAALVADFTLDLRRLNSVKIQASQMSLPPLQFSNVLQHVHQSFLVEMSTPEERNMEEEAGDNDHDNLHGSMNVIQAAGD